MPSGSVPPVRFRRMNPHVDVAINMAPLVDVVFLLVIFFAVSTTFLETSGLKLELPSSNSTAQRETKDLTVFLGAGGELSFEGEQLEEDQLGPRLQQALSGRERKLVILRADTETSHGDVVRLMDLIRGAGAEAMTIAARSQAP